MGIRGYMRGYARVWVGMRECAAVCAGIREYMREYAAVCVGIREYMREYAYARVCAPAHFQTRCVNHFVCQARLLGGNSKCYDFLSALNMRKRLCGLLKYPAVTWGKAILFRKRVVTRG